MQNKKIEITDTTDLCGFKCVFKIKDIMKFEEAGFVIIDKNKPDEKGCTTVTAILPKINRLHIFQDDNIIESNLPKCIYEAIHF